MLYTLSRSILLYSIFFGNIITSQKLSMPDLSNLSLGKLNECKRCQVLTNSFNYWLDKTSRGKFEGGDASWEENKLKSYARSEIRLVEVQEGLCSELKKNQDECYALAEEAEQALELWWFHENSNSVDLHTWLCTETLKYCCLDNHYGVDCDPCPIDAKNQVCGGRGRCNGDGTRQGNGTCLCGRGYVGKYCQECANNYFSAGIGSCEPCHKACDGCTEGGPEACSKCNTGWEMKSGICVDINECKNPNTCKANRYCINHEGAHSCKTCDKSCKTCIGEGALNCASCDNSSVFWSGMCMDDKYKQNILECLKRQALYFGLLLIAFYIYRFSKSLASLVVLVIAVYIYYSEKNSTNKLVDVLETVYYAYTNTYHHTGSLIG